jgi:hypothetical protein
MNPWRAYLLLLQELVWCTGADEGMIRSDLHRAQIPLMDVETLHNHALSFIPEIVQARDNEYLVKKLT